MYTQRSTSRSNTAAHHYKLTRQQVTKSIDKHLQNKNTTGDFVDAIGKLSPTHMADMANNTIRHMRDDIVYNRPSITPQHLRLMCISGGVDVSMLFNIDHHAKTATPTGSALNETSTQKKEDIWNHVVSGRKSVDIINGGNVGAYPDTSSPHTNSQGTHPSHPHRGGSSIIKKGFDEMMKLVGIGSITAIGMALNDIRQNEGKNFTTDNIMNELQHKNVQYIAGAAMFVSFIMRYNLMGSSEDETAVKRGQNELNELIRAANLPIKYYQRIIQQYPSMTLSSFRMLTKQEFNDLSADLELSATEKEQMYRSVYLVDSERKTLEKNEKSKETLQSRVDEILLQEENEPVSSKQIFTKLYQNRNIEDDLYKRGIPYDFFTTTQMKLCPQPKVLRKMRERVISDTSFFGSGNQGYSKDELEALKKLYFNIQTNATYAKKIEQPFSNALSPRPSDIPKFEKSIRPVQTTRKKSSSSVKSTVTATKAKVSSTVSLVKNAIPLFVLPAGYLLYMWLCARVSSTSFGNPTFTELYNSPSTQKTIGRDHFAKQRGDYDYLNNPFLQSIQSDFAGKELFAKADMIPQGHAFQSQLLQ